VRRAHDSSRCTCTYDAPLCACVRSGPHLRGLQVCARSDSPAGWLVRPYGGMRRRASGWWGIKESQRGPRAFCSVDRRRGVGGKEAGMWTGGKERGLRGPDYWVHLLADSVAHESPYDWVFSIDGARSRSRSQHNCKFARVREVTDVYGPQCLEHAETGRRFSVLERHETPRTRIRGPNRARSYFFSGCRRTFRMIGESMIAGIFCKNSLLVQLRSGIQSRIIPWSLHADFCVGVRREARTGNGESPWPKLQVVCSPSTLEYVTVVHKIVLIVVCFGPDVFL